MVLSKSALRFRIVVTSTVFLSGVLALAGFPRAAANSLQHLPVLPSSSTSAHRLRSTSSCRAALLETHAQTHVESKLSIADYSFLGAQKVQPSHRSMEAVTFTASASRTPGTVAGKFVLDELEMNPKLDDSLFSGQQLEGVAGGAQSITPASYSHP